MQATQDSLRSRIMRLETELQNFQSSKCENPESFTRDTKVKSSIAIEGTPPKAIKSKPSTEVVYTHKSQNKKVKTKQTIKQAVQAAAYSSEDDSKHYDLEETKDIKPNFKHNTVKTHSSRCED